MEGLSRAGGGGVRVPFLIFSLSLSLSALLVPGSVDRQSC